MFTVPGTIVFPVAPLANAFKTADFSAGNMTWSRSASRSFWVYIPLVANDDGAEYRHVWRTSGRSSCDSTHSMLRHLPGSFPQRHPILRYALDTYYGCLQSSYICGYKGGTWCSASREP
ncbi:uncharacterized protein LOC126872957 isoform X6 [Bombus huntii]|uniref:uncharacterized protein LOC126872957 isoform X6 n=1 Tax=Bombus huntii TaxID=85661 RepID=UPI0021AA5D29|nr:uncharacterized protein LOC126872957 isoform X6 [Bombus huntii]